jgi:hypothetical protein
MQEGGGGQRDSSLHKILRSCTDEDVFKLNVYKNKNFWRGLTLSMWQSLQVFFYSLPSEDTFITKNVVKGSVHHPFSSSDPFGTL